MPTIAFCMQQWQHACMAVQITIRDVPEKVRDELAARAALQGKSMQEFLRSELERMAARPSVSTWLEHVRKRKRASATQVSSEQILRSREADRR
jgi:plasmid stability protein